ncbi:uncharacterized protein LOC129582422 [Paramacrobiotus metropolitanus]|uniref:uncharacterized protein LOC129582422 n=1 Tax=Paramacrobiotus metropolitanus TaxID=2943436 RepID=UPI0024461D8F|nr:uncharacterized protein LOC129582422 [Paramacrobiotus metropolitanus]
MNALNRSDICTPRELQHVYLDVEDLHWKLLYSYSVFHQTENEAGFVRHLCDALSNYTKSLVVFKYSDRFSVAVYFPKPLKVGVENTDVGEIVYFELFHGRVEKRIVPEGMRVYLGEDLFQMYAPMKENIRATNNQSSIRQKTDSFETSNGNIDRENSFIWVKGQRPATMGSRPRDRTRKNAEDKRPVNEVLGLPLDELPMDYEIRFSIAVLDPMWFSRTYTSTEKMDYIKKHRLMGVEIYYVGTVKQPDGRHTRPNLTPLSLGNTTIPVHIIQPAKVADFLAPDFDNPLPEHAATVAQLKAFKETGMIMLGKRAESFMPFIRVIHYYSQTETQWCSNFVQMVLDQYGRSAKGDCEVLQILLYIPQMAIKFAQHFADIDSVVGLELLCALLHSTATLPTSHILQEARTITEKMNDRFSAKEYTELLKASVMVLDPSVGIEFNRMLFEDEDPLVESDYLRRFGYLSCLDLLGERTNQQREKKGAPQLGIQMVDNNKNQPVGKLDNGKTKKIKFIYRAQYIAERPRVGDIVLFTRMNKPKRSESVFDAKNADTEFPALERPGVVKPKPNPANPVENVDAGPVVCVGVVKDISPDIIVHFDAAPPPEVALATWEMEVLGNLTTFKHAVDAVATFVAQKENGTLAFNAIMGLPFEEVVADENEKLEEFFALLKKIEEKLGEKKDPRQNVVKINESQKAAVRMACSNKLTVIQGPPGTGKTQTIAFMLHVLMERYGKCRVLAVASTNTAADNILRGILKLKTLIKPDDIDFSPVRVGDKSAVAKDLQQYTLADLAEGRTRNGTKKSAQKVLQTADLIVGTCVGAGLADLKGVVFDVVIIDEASQVTEPCALIAIVKAARVVLVGDHQQLPPQVHELAKSDVPGLDLSVSLFDRLVHSDAIHVQMLDEHHRSHPFIIDFCSRIFYGGRLKAVVSPADRPLPLGIEWPNPDKPVVFINVQEAKRFQYGLRVNHAEAEMVVRVLEKLLLHGEANVTAKEIGVVTPYRHQVQHLIKTLKETPALKILAKDIEVVTIDGFQVH